MSGKSIWMPLYIGDYLSETQLLTTEQHGAYLLIVMAYWKNGGPIPDSNEMLCGITRMAPAKWKKNSEVILSFFTKKSGKLHSSRIDAELARAKKTQAAAAEKARKAAAARWESDAPSNAPSIPPSNAPMNASQSHSHSQNKNPPVPGQDSVDTEYLGEGMECDPVTGEVVGFGGAR